VCSGRFASADAPIRLSFRLAALVNSDKIVKVIEAGQLRRLTEVNPIVEESRPEFNLHSLIQL